MPTDQRVRLKDFQRIQNSGSQTIEPGKNKAIMLLKATRFWGFAPQHIELVSED